MKKIIIICLFIIYHIIYDVIADSVVHEMYYNGLKRISVDSILCNLPIQIGTIINQDDISNCIRILFDTGYFETISISYDYEFGKMIITVDERPIINTVKIYKNKTINSEIIEKILNSKNIKSGTLLNHYTIHEVKKELKKTYANLGKFNAKIQIVIIPLNRNRSDVQVILSEGCSTKIKNINIFGNRFFSEKQLLKQLTLHNQRRWKILKFSKKYQKQNFFYDIEKLYNFYLHHGYAKFQLDDIQVNFTPDQKYASLSIYLTEGYQYVFKSLVISGNKLNNIPEITEYLKIRSGELYDNKKIQEIELHIKHILDKYGYIKSHIYTEYSFDDDHRTVSIYMYIDVGNRFYVREIKFEGNDITQDSVIRREITQMEQTPLNYINLVIDKQQLRRFGYFKTIDTHITHISNILNQVDLIYKVEERNTGNLNLSLGYGLESGLNIQINLYQENLLGTGNTISMAVAKNRYQTYFDASILKKYIGIKNINISSKIFYNNFLYDTVKISNYNMKNYGVCINYSGPFTKYKFYDIGLNYISNNLSHIQPQIAIWRYLYAVGVDPLKKIYPRDLNSSINFSSNDVFLMLSWNFDNLNRPYFPESGTHSTITSNITLPGSYNKYYKIMINNKNYLSLDIHSKWILENIVYTGYTGGLYHQKESPFYNNFYIGGIETVRGFQLSSIGPKAAYYNCDYTDLDFSTCTIQNSSDSVGGNAIILVKNELVTPILSYMNLVEYFDSARISIFLDTGTVWDTHWKNTELTRAAGISDYSMFNKIRVSSGISFKWMSPIGPIMLSYSKLIKQYPGDIEEPFQFSIGKSW